MMKIGLIDYYLDQYHALKYPSWLSELSGGQLQVSCAYAMTDKPSGKPSQQCADEGGYPLLSSIEEVIEQSDGIIVMSPDNAEMHVQLCEKPLQSKKPVYVDKTFAVNRADALAIIENGQKHGTPFYSASALRYATEYDAITKDGLLLLDSMGAGRFENYAVHQVEPIIKLMGQGVRRVQALASGDVLAFCLQYEDGRIANFHQVYGAQPFALRAGYQDGHLVEAKAEGDYYAGFLKDLVGFFTDGQPRVAAEELLEIITVIDCCRQALQKPGSWVQLP